MFTSLKPVCLCGYIQEMLVSGQGGSNLTFELINNKCRLQSKREGVTLLKRFENHLYQNTGAGLQATHRRRLLKEKKIFTSFTAMPS